MGGDKEIEVSGTVIGESSKISLTVKTALWIIGGIIALFTVAYFDVKSEVKVYKEKVDKEKQEFVKNVEDRISEKFDKQIDKNQQYVKDIEEIRGNVRLLLDRTQGSRVNTVSESTPTINNNTPTTTPIITR